MSSNADDAVIATLDGYADGVSGAQPNRYLSPADTETRGHYLDGYNMGRLERERRSAPAACSLGAPGDDDCEACQ